jgi:hypothetical protein
MRTAAHLRAPTPPSLRSSPLRVDDRAIHAENTRLAMPQVVYDYEQLHRDRLAARRAQLEAEEKQRELTRLRHEHGAIRAASRSSS